MPSRPPKIYRLKSLQDLYHFYLRTLVNKPSKDPRGQNVRFHKNNFTYLIQLERAKSKIKPSREIPKIEKGEIDFSNFDSYDVNRAERLHWIADIIKHPDEIYINSHNVIKADYIYIKKYNKKGAPYRVFFAKQIRNSVIPVTSFGVTEKAIRKFRKGQLLWRRRSSKKWIKKRRDAQSAPLLLL